MSDTSGPTSATPSSPFAQWSPSLRTWTDTGLLGLTLCLGTLPTWGCLRDGELFELPTPEPPTVASESSSLLPSPISRDVKEQTLGWTWQRDGVTQEDTLPRAITSLLPTHLLSTPRARLENNDDVTRDRGKRNLEDQIAALLPTPKAGDGERGRDLPRLRPDEASRELATAVGPLLPTPRAQNGEERNANIWERPLDQPQNLENALARIGASTPPPSDAGNPSSDDPHLLPLFPAPTDAHA